MKAHVLEAVNQLVYKDVPTPELHPGEALVEVMAAGICGSDIPRIFETGTYHFPTIPGHEFSGRVVDVYREGGAEAQSLKLGSLSGQEREAAVQPPAPGSMSGREKDGAAQPPVSGDLSGWIGRRVAVFPLIPCRECPPCRNRQYEMCQHYNYLGSRCDGGFAEYVAVPVWNLMPLPDTVSYEAAALFEPASVALHAVRRLELEGVQSVALFGLGTIGVLIAEWLYALGVPKVYATGHRAQHGGLMKSVTCEAYEYLQVGQSCAPGQPECGCRTDVVSQPDSSSGTDDAGQSPASSADWILQQTGGLGADVVIDCVATPSSLADALLAVCPGGQILEVGNPKGDMNLSRDIYWKLLRKQIRLTGTWNSSYTREDTDDWHTTLGYCADGRLKLEELVTHRLPFDELEKGLRMMRGRTEYHNKVMIVRE
jgi:L-iditol 2-dehydrogenase